MIALRGLPGAGKTTLARGLKQRADQVGVPMRILSRDEVRKTLFAPCDWSDDEKTVSFEAMLHAGAYHLNRTRSVIFDGMAFTRQSEIGAVRALAEACGARAIVVDCRVPLDVAVARVAAEGATRDPDLGREYGIDVVRIASERQEPCDVDLPVDMSRTPEVIAEEVFAKLVADQDSASPAL